MIVTLGFVASGLLYPEVVPPISWFFMGFMEWIAECFIAMAVSDAVR